MAIRIDIDRELCIGAQTCVSLLPSVFQIDDEGLAVTTGATAAFEELIAVAKECPTEAIRITLESTS